MRTTKILLFRHLPGSKTEPGLRKDEDNKDPVIQAFAGLSPYTGQGGQTSGKNAGQAGLRKDEDNKDLVIQAFAGLNYAKRPTKRRG